MAKSTPPTSWPVNSTAVLLPAFTRNRHRAVVIAAAFTVVAAAWQRPIGATGSQTPTETPLRVSIAAAWSPDTAGIVTVAVQELAAVWRANGVDVVRYSSRLTVKPLALVTLIVARVAPPSTSSGALGWIGFSEGASVPVIYVSLPATHSHLQTVSTSGVFMVQLPEVLRERMLARAIGRVAAHELGHYLLASRQHTVSGLMRSEFAARELVDNGRLPFQLGRDERLRLATRMREADFLAVDGRGSQ